MREKPLPDIELEMVRLAEEAAQAGMVRRVKPEKIEEKLPDARGMAKRKFGRGRPRKTLVTVSG